MGTSAVILTKKEGYSPEKLLADSIVAAFHAGVTLYFHNNQQYDKEGHFSYTTLNINERPFYDSGNSSFLFYIHSKKSPSIDFYYHENLGLDAELELSQVGHIEDIYGVQKLIFIFIYEYLRVNPNDLFWITDYDWIYTWEDMQNLKSLPYDPDWCYKDPKLLPE